MTTHTDRIRQMAQEADAHADALDGSGKLGHRTWRQAREEYFAQLVAEDCAMVCDERAVEMAGFTEEEHASQHLAEAIRARYSLKD